MQNFQQLLFQHFRRNFMLYTVVSAFFLFGVVMGSLGVQVIGPDQATELGDFINGFLTKIRQENVIPHGQLGQLIWGNMKLLLVFYLLGLTLLGLVLVPFVLFVRGFLLGFALGYFTLDQAWQGVMLSLAALLPHSLVNIPLLLAAGVLSMRFSLLLLSSENSRQSFPARLWQFTLINAGLIVVSIGSAGLEGYISPVLVKVVAGLW